MSCKSVVVFFLPICIFAQLGGTSNGVSVSGEIRGASPVNVDHLYIDLRPLDSAAISNRVTTDSEGHFTIDNIGPGSYRLQIPTQPGGEPIYEDSIQLNGLTGPLTIEIPSRLDSRPISGVVSVQQLRPPPSKKALRAFADAEKFSHAHEIGKAIEKLELAVRLDPEFREAHLNLGAQFTKLGRYQEAMTHLYTSIAIGPPDPKAYSNLALCYLKLDQYSDAGSFAKKALALDPGNGPAQTILRVAQVHRD